MDLSVQADVQLIVKVQQFEDKRIQAKASWNIKELKGKLSEIYPTVSSGESDKLHHNSIKTINFVQLCRSHQNIKNCCHHTLFFFIKSTSHSKYDDDLGRKAKLIEDP
jgi:hypothetical protein